MFFPPKDPDERGKNHVAFNITKHPLGFCFPFRARGIEYREVWTPSAPSVCALSADGNDGRWNHARLHCLLEAVMHGVLCSRSKNILTARRCSG